MTETIERAPAGPAAAITLHDLARILGLSYVACWELVQRGGLPFPIHRLGRRYSVPRGPVEALYGAEAVRRALGEPEAAS